MKIYVAEDEITQWMSGKTHPDDPFLVHRERLASVSKTICNMVQAFEKNSPNTQPELHFPEDSINAWECFLHWLMHGNVRLDPELATPVVLI